MKRITLLPTPIGPLDIQLENNTITKINFLSQKTSSETFHKKIKSEFEKYFKNPHHIFTLDFQLSGTLFQQRVWKEIHKIPAGEVRTYKDIAEKLKTSPRAVGNACRANPIPLIIPCHRVVGKNHLGGFAGDVSGKLINIKKWLLQHENAMIFN